MAVKIEGWLTQLVECFAYNEKVSSSTLLLPKTTHFSSYWMIKF